jgi:alanine-glyoxylate transaminase/(R)-3-amino-2-methylpropionate-pyruvate transaminase
MLGIELVKDRGTKEPAKAECAQMVETCKDLGLLVGKGGLPGNAIRFAPPMCITQADADFMLEVFDAAFAQRS